MQVRTIVANLQTTVQNNFGDYSGGNDWVGQDVVEFLGDLQWIHDVHLSSSSTYSIQYDRSS